MISCSTIRELPWTNCLLGKLGKATTFLSTETPPRATVEEGLETKVINDIPFRREIRRSVKVLMILLLPHLLGGFFNAMRRLSGNLLQACVIKSSKFGVDFPHLVNRLPRENSTHRSMLVSLELNYFDRMQGTECNTIQEDTIN